MRKKLRARVVRSPKFVTFEVTGQADLQEFLDLIKVFAVQTKTEGDTLALINLKGVEGTLGPTGHFLIGEHIARRLTHLAKVASVVLSQTMTRVSEKAARAQGTQLRVFDSHDQAIEWLLDPRASAETAPEPDNALMDPVRTVFWDAFRHLFPPHAQAVQIANGSLLISWSIANDPNAIFEMSTPITVRFEPELLENMRAASAEQRESLAAKQEQYFRAGLVGYDPYAVIPKARVIVLG